jgi:deoxyribodipyrimidine photo-lyase
MDDGLKTLGASPMHQATEPLAQTLVDHCEETGIRTCVLPLPTVGPLKDQLAESRSQLKDHGITIVPVQRMYDQLCWPHAAKGFFKLKTKIPMLLNQMGLT